MFEDIINDREKRIFAAGQSSLFFSLYYFQHYHHFKMPDFHRDWYRDLDDDKIQGIMMIGFRECAKTSIAKIKEIQNICYKKRNFIIWTSKDISKARANLFDIALELQTNKRIIEDFGQLFWENNIEDERYSQKKSIGEFITSNGVKVKAYSTGQSPRGEVYGDVRPDEVILDDYENLETIDSEAYTNEVKFYIDELLSGLGGSAKIISLSNRLTFGGSVSYLENRVKELPNWRVYDIPVIKDGEITWKDKYVRTDLEAEIANQGITEARKKRVSLESKLKLLGWQVYNREMLNTPLTENEIEFKKQWYKYIPRNELGAMRTRKFLAIDPAISEKDHADYTGLIDCEVDSQGFWYVSAEQVRMNPADLVNYMFTKYLKNGYEAIGLERIAFTEGLEPFLREQMRIRGIFLPIRDLMHGGTKKETRIRGLIPRYSNGSIYHVVGECEDLEKQQQTFPKSEYDDLLDAEAYLLQLISPATSAGEPVNRETFKPDLSRYNRGFANNIKNIQSF